LRILVLTPEYLPEAGGGIITFYREFLPRLAARGHKVRVLVGSGVSASAAADATTIDGVRVERLELARLRRHLLRFTHFDAMPRLRAHLAAASAMWEQAREDEGADVVEACDWGLSFVPPLLEGSIPVVVQAHGSVGQIGEHDPLQGEEAQNILTRMLEVDAMRRAAAVQTLSGANAEFWRRQTGRDVSAIAPAWTVPQVQDTDASSPRGLVIGRVQRWKGPQVLCEALQLLGRRAPSIDWVGHDTVLGRRGKSCSQSLAKTFPTVWGPLIRHLPQVPPREVAKLQRAARFVVAPSTWDVFNFTCIEAMASGRPVICSRGAGASELIEHGVNGFVFENGDAHALAEAIRHVLSLDETQQQRIGAAARETVAKALDPERRTDERLRRYAEVVAGFEPRPAISGDCLREACCGRDAPASALAFLDHMPLKPLLAYCARRLLSKVPRSNA